METRTKRSMPQEIAERRRLRAIARPYAKDIMKWQSELAFHRHRKSSAKATNEDTLTVGAGLGDLLATVQQAREQFQAKAAGEPMAGAVEDVSRALERLVEQIAAELGRPA
jgi:hypothetical protein